MSGTSILTVHNVSHMDNSQTNLALEFGESTMSPSSSFTNGSSEPMSSPITKGSCSAHSPRRPPPLLMCDGGDDGYDERNLHVQALEELAMSFDASEGNISIDVKNTSRVWSSKLWCITPFRSLSVWKFCNAPTAASSFFRKAVSSRAATREVEYEQSKTFERCSLEEDLNVLAQDFV